MSALTVFFIALSSLYQLNAEEVICMAGQACNCATTAPNDGEACVMNCAREDVCKAQALRCREGSPCYVRCEAKNACSETTTINGHLASDVTVVCAGDSACKDNIEIICGIGDCRLHCHDITSCEAFGTIYTDTATGFLCSGEFCPESGNLAGQIPAAFSASPTVSPSSNPTVKSSNNPSFTPSNNPVQEPSANPVSEPTNLPSVGPTKTPSNAASNAPSNALSNTPSNTPSNAPSNAPSGSPSEAATLRPSNIPTQTPVSTMKPSANPTNNPSLNPSFMPSATPTDNPTSLNPSIYPSNDPSFNPSFDPSFMPTIHPLTRIASDNPTNKQSQSPTYIVTDPPSASASAQQTNAPTLTPTETDKPTVAPTERPSEDPTMRPSETPTLRPTEIESTETIETTEITVSVDALSTVVQIRETDSVDSLERDLVVKKDGKGTSTGAIVAAITGVCFMLMAFGWFLRYRYGKREEQEGRSRKNSGDIQEMTLMDDNTEENHIDRVDTIVDVDVNDGEFKTKGNAIGAIMNFEELEEDDVIDVQKKALINDGA